MIRGSIHTTFSRPTRGLLAAAFLLAAAALPRPAAGAAPAGPAPRLRLTIYNDGLAVVGETRTVTLEKGEGDLRLDEVTALLQPDSVVLRDPADPDGFRVLLQTHLGRPIDAREMLRRSEGKPLQFRAVNPVTGAIEVLSGRLIRSGGGADPSGGDTAPIVELAGGKILFGLPGEPLFDSLPADAALRPMLRCRVVVARAGRRDLDLSYATGGLSWAATYNAVLPAEGDRLDLSAWVGLENRSGVPFRDARVRLVAGQVERAARPPVPVLAFERKMAMAAEADAGLQATGRAFDEYHLYTLERPVTLEDGQSTQVEFRRAASVPSSRVYVFDGARQPGVRAAIEFRNGRESGLGLPLPAGVLRLFRAGDDGGRELVGESRIDHLPADATVRAGVGTAFDLQGERAESDLKMDQGRETAEESVTVRLKNQKTGPVEIRVVEHLERFPTWRVLTSSDPFDRKDARTIEFRVKVPPAGERTVTYQVRYNW